MKKIFLNIILICLLLSSCGGGGGGNETDSYSYSTVDNLSFLDINDAKSIFIGTSSDLQKVAGKTADNSIVTSRNNLYKINGNGIISKIKFLDKNNEGIESIRQFDDSFYDPLYSPILTPVFVSNINSDYFVVGFCWMAPDWDMNNDNVYKPEPAFLFLIRKADGAVYKLKNIGLNINDDNIVTPDFFSPNNKQFFKADALGHFYYLNNGDEWVEEKYFSGFVCGNHRRITKISILGNGKVISTDITPSVDEVQCFDVDDSGNIIYSYFGSNSWPKRMRNASGSFKNFSTVTGIDDNQIIPIWKSADGCFYYSYCGIKKIKPMNLEIEDYNNLSLNFLWPYGFYKFDFINKTFLVHPGGIAEVYNATASLQNNSFAGLTVSNISHACSTENYIYVAGKDTSSNYFLIKVVPETGANTKLLWNEYEVLSFTASETDGIVFNALRIADGKKVLGKMSADGGPVTILSTEKDAEVYYLERIR